MKYTFNKDRREFLTSSAAAGLCVACGGMISTMLASCDTIDEGEPKINIADYPELQKVGGAIRKRYSKLNNGEPILIIRIASDNFVVYSALCTHKGVEVKLPKDGEIVCPNHGSRFRISDGEVIDGKAIEPLQRFQTRYDAQTSILTIS